MNRGEIHSVPPHERRSRAEARTPDRRSTFLQRLLTGTLADDEGVVREATALALDLDTPRSVILVDARRYVRNESADDNLPHERRTQRVVDSIAGFFRLPNDAICADLDNGEIAVLKASNTRNLALWASPKDAAEDGHSTWANLVALKGAGRALLAHLQSEIGVAFDVGIGRYHPGLHGIARSYQDARAALSLGRARDGENRVHCLDALGTAAFVGISEEQTKMELAARLLGPLDREPALLETLRSYFAEDCSPSHTARRLSIHRNTLAYRMQKIASLTGLDPRHFDEAAQIHLALLLRSLDRRT